MKKTISIILAIMLMVSLFGCTNQNAHDHGETALDTSVNETIDGTIGTTDEDIETTDPVDDEVTEPVEDNDDETEPVEDENGGETETTEPVETQPVEDNTEATEPVETQPVETEHVHNYTSVVTAPTCEDKGYTTYTCTCGDSYTADETKATGHSYKTTTVAPTTSSKGYDLHECKVCGKSYKDNYTDKLSSSDNGNSGNGGSNTGSNTSDKGSSTGTGYYWYSVVKGGYVEYTAEELDALCADGTHQWETTAHVDSTCSTAGYEDKVCTWCGKTERWEIGKKTHTVSVKDITGNKWAYVVPLGAEGCGMCGGATWFFNTEAEAFAFATKYAQAFLNGNPYLNEDGYAYYVRKVYATYDITWSDNTTCVHCGQHISNPSAYNCVDANGNLLGDGWKADYGVYTAYSEKFKVTEQQAVIDYCS